MSPYIPGSGLKKPLNMFENPVYPDIKKAPPRFVWTKKHWKVDTGRTMAEIEHIPQLQENAVLFQSYDYGSQHAYGKFPSYTTFVNEEFRPPLIDRDDLLPLSRIPRPVVVPRINPGGAHPSGNSVFAEQNMGISQVEKYLSDRVKEGEIRPTFFAPMYMPEDNSVLPDLEVNIPCHSASSGFHFPNIHRADHPEYQLEYSRPQISVSSGASVMRLDAPDSQQEMELDYNRPQVSATSGRQVQYTPGLTVVDFDLDYSRPQVSATSGQQIQYTPGLTVVDFDLDYSRPQTSASSGFTSYTSDAERDQHVNLETKLEGTQPVWVTPNARPIYDSSAGTSSVQPGSMRVEEVRHQYEYGAQANAMYHPQPMLDHEQQVPFRQKARALSYNPQITQSCIPRRGISTPQTRLRGRKDLVV